MIIMKAVTLLIVTTDFTIVTGQQEDPLQPPPPPMLPVEEVGGCSRSFFSALVQLIPCRAAVAPFSPIPPTESCCSAVVSLGRPCLCLLANGPPCEMLPVEEVGGCSRSFFSALAQLIPCRAAVAPFSPIPPTESCCSAVVSLGRPCLCLLANGPPCGIIN